MDWKFKPGTNMRRTARVAVLACVAAMAACASANRVQAIDRAVRQGKMPALVETVAKGMNAGLPADYVEGMTWHSARSSGLTIDGRLSAPKARLDGKSPDVAASLMKKVMLARVCGTDEFTRLLHHGMVLNLNLEDDHGRPFTHTAIRRGDCDG